MKKTSILKRFLCLALCMVLVLGFVPVQARALGAVASISVNGTVVGTYETLEDAFEAVDLCNAEDNVVITLLQDVTVENSCDVYSGVFTIDLNGHEMNNAEDSYCVLQIYNADTTIVDSVGTGQISGKENAIVSRGGSLTITGGSFTADGIAIYVNSCEGVTITGGFASKYASVSFEGALAVNYYFTPSVDADEMNLYYWSPSIYEWVDALTPETALGCVQMEKQANGSYWAQLTYLPAKWIDDTIYVAATYEKDGVTYCTGIVAYSISTYCLNQADGPMGDLAFATAAYGCFARWYFSIIV